VKFALEDSYFHTLLPVSCIQTTPLHRTHSSYHLHGRGYMIRMEGVSYALRTNVSMADIARLQRNRMPATAAQDLRLITVPQTSMSASTVSARITALVSMASLITPVTASRGGKAGCKCKQSHYGTSADHDVLNTLRTGDADLRF
jgi:hypothetical protein